VGSGLTRWSIRASSSTNSAELGGCSRARERILYSAVARCELFAGREVEEETVHRLLAPFEEVSVDRPVAERAGRLRRAGGLRTPDALIAATALEYELVLVTRNVSDFGQARSLKLRSSI
jgi:predicted nucleic acid-binding protein